MAERRLSVVAAIDDNRDQMGMASMPDLRALPARDCPTFGENLFAPDALRDPFGHYRRMRDLGPVVRLQCTGIYALPRYREVRNALTSPDRLISGNGVGFNDPFNTIPPEPPVIQRDGDSHRALRRVVAANLTPAALKRHRELLKAIITERVVKLIDTGWVDAVPQLAQRLPLEAVTQLVGLPQEGRERMLDWAAAGFNAVGPIDLPQEREAFARDFGLFAQARNYLEHVDRKQLVPGSWTASLFDAVDAALLTSGEARAAMSAYVIPSLDTTIYAMTSLLYNLGCNPDQFNALKADPDLIPGAVFEGVRHSATVRWFSRTAQTDYVDGEVFIPAGARVMLLYGSANRDERHYPDPDLFDVKRRATDQLGWGTGPHLCVGMHLARLEMEVLVEAMVECIGSIAVRDPVRSTNRGLYGFVQLPINLRSSPRGQ